MKRLGADVGGFTDKLYRFRNKEYAAFGDRDKMLAELVVTCDVNVKFR